MGRLRLRSSRLRHWAKLGSTLLVLGGICPVDPPSGNNLTVNVSGMGTVTSSDGGINCPTDCNQGYSGALTTIQVTAHPAEGWDLDSWQDASPVGVGGPGTVRCASPPSGSKTASVLVNGSVVCNITFVRTPLFTVERTGGGASLGQITAQGLMCGWEMADCTERYRANTMVMLNVTTKDGATFRRWSGSCSGNSPMYMLQIGDMDLSCTAEIDPPPPSHWLRVTVYGQGVVTGTPGLINCPGPGQCTYTFIGEPEVELTATPADGWFFDYFQPGGPAGYADVLCHNAQTSFPRHPVTRTKMDHDRLCDAHFVKMGILEVLRTGAGANFGRIESNPPGILCNETANDCEEPFPPGTDVTLTANWETGNATFSSWTGTGACTGSAPSVTITVQRTDIDCRAEFGLPAATSLVTLQVAGQGTITSDIPGFECDEVQVADACMEAIAIGTVVTLNANPDPGFEIGQWAGTAPGCTGSDPQITITVPTVNSTCGITFDVMVPTYLVSVIRAGPGAAFGTITGPGINCSQTSADCEERFPENADVTLTATWESSNASFASWTGTAPCISANPVLSFSVEDYDIRCEARFEVPDETTVLVLGVAGQGTITSDIPGFECDQVQVADACTESIAVGTEVTLFADPDPGFEIGAWAGTAPGCTGSDAQITITVPSVNSTCGITFEVTAPTYLVTINRTGGGAAFGTVTSSPPGIICNATTNDCEERFPENADVTLTATWESNGTGFVSWSGPGACTGTNPEITVTVGPADITCLAEFAPPPPARLLTVTVTGPGTVTSTPPGITCDQTNDPTVCTRGFSEGELVTLVASPAAGHILDEWTGSLPDCTGDNLSIVVIMPATPLSLCGATFVPIPTVTLNVSLSGTGAGWITGQGIDCGQNGVGGSDCSETVQIGTQFTLNFTGSGGATVTGGSGLCASGTFPITLTLNASGTCGVVIGAPTSIVFTPRGGYSLGYNPGTWTRTPGGNSLIVVSEQGGSEGNVEEISISNLDALSRTYHGPLCAGLGGVAFATEGSFSFIYGFSDQSTFGCYTPDPLGQARGGFNQGFVAAEAGVMPGTTGNSTIIVNAFSRGAVFRMPLGGIYDYIQLTPLADRSCPRFLDMRGTTLAISGQEGVVGTTTENCNNHRGVWWVDLGNNSVLGFTPVGDRNRDLTISQDGQRAYLADLAGQVHVLDVASRSVLHSFPAGTGPTATTLVGPNDSHLLVTDCPANRIRMYDLATRTEVSSVDSGGECPISMFKLELGTGDPEPGQPILTSLLILNHGDPAEDVDGSIQVMDVEIP